MTSKKNSPALKPPQPGDLLNAVLSNDIDDVKRLLQQGAPVDEADATGNTPLAWAAGKGHLEIVRALLEHGADVNSRNRMGTSPLMMVVYQTYHPGRTIIMRLLLDKGADLGFKNLKGETALDIATSMSRLDAVRILKDEAIRRQRIAEEFAKAAAAKREEELREKRRELNERAKKSPRPVIIKPKPPKAE